jgi:hypothetical protein
MFVSQFVSVKALWTHEFSQSPLTSPSKDIFYLVIRITLVVNWMSVTLPTLPKLLIQAHECDSTLTRLLF